MAMQLRNPPRKNSTNSAGGDMNPDRAKVSCIFCPTIIDDKIKAMNCDFCENWVCIKCAKISSTTYAELKNPDVGKAFSWTCSKCNGKSMMSSLQMINQNILELKKSNEDRLSSVENKIHKLESTVRDTVKTEVDIAKEEINQSVQNNLAATVSSLVDNRLHEMEDRKNRSLNLVFFHVPQSNDPNPMVRKSHDNEIIKRVYSELFPDEEFKITKSFRLGRNKENSDKILPLKVVCDSKEQRRKLLTNSKQIGEIKDSNMKRIIVARDLTKEQQEASKKIRKEKLNREENGDSVRLRHGRVEESEGATAPSSY